MAQLHSDTLAELQRASGDLDQVIGEMQLGTRSQAHVETLEEQVQAIATRMVQAVRGRNARPSAAPIRHRDGKAWF
ncbi:hypothetical protein [Stakelama tenebrarum]|uniref:Uncharacterized protein n=1 Tax=Stakelama tenebrarum TaxID=2711215 RepID=A0A6G6Y684_9SPHN|nr:hypothetical protein [Sphingosinithalassobacter tenebrarum]QIG80093.1 hypothetical protein G5C33_10080 [Sphingosinithalassobacter tenebrarum]